VDQRRALVEPHGPLPIKRQCELVGLSRSAYYYRPCPVSESDLRRMRIMDEVFTQHPYYGSRRLCHALARQGLPTSRDRVRRLMRLLGISAVYPKPRLSVSGCESERYPY